jgi:hypothetical protein
LSVVVDTMPASTLLSGETGDHVHLIRIAQFRNGIISNICCCCSVLIKKEPRY